MGTVVVFQVDRLAPVFDYPGQGWNGEWTTQPQEEIIILLVLSGLQEVLDCFFDRIVQRDPPGLTGFFLFQDQFILSQYIVDTEVQDITGPEIGIDPQDENTQIPGLPASIFLMDLMSLVFRIGSTVIEEPLTG